MTLTTTYYRKENCLYKVCLNFSFMCCRKSERGYWTSRESSLVLVSSCSNTGSIRDDLYWKNILELVDLSTVNKVSLV